MFFAIIFSSYLASAVTGPFLLMCLSEGESLPNATTPYYTCSTTSCTVCARERNLDPRGVPSALCAGLNCTYLNGGPGGDTIAPNVTINSPEENRIYSDDVVTLDVSSNEFSKLERYDNTRRRWILLCSSCKSYSRDLRIDDGAQTLRVRATDSKGNSAEKEVGFFVDTVKPKITSALPKKGKFASGHFEVVFKEQNPETVAFYYGLNGGANSSLILELETDCLLNNKKYYCSIDVDISEYDTKELKYWFSVTDIAGSTYVSKETIVKVDTTSPVINNLGSFYNVIGKYMYINMSITEINFDSVDYIDYYDRTPRWKTLCSSLKEGYCAKKKTFGDGPHNVEIQVWDEVGNYALIQGIPEFIVE